MAITEELRIEIIAQSKQAVKELKKTEKATGSLGKSFKKLAITAAAAFAIREVVKVAKASVEAYKVQETAIRNLNSALEATGQYTDGASAELQRYASELQGLTVVGDEASLAAMQLGINMGLSSEEVKGATEQAIGLSRAYGVDLKTAMRAVASAQKGNTSMLSRYMPQIREATTEAEKLAIAQESLASAFAVAKGEVDTLAGAQQQMKNAVGDLGELFGSLLAPGLKASAERITEMVGGIQEFVTEIHNATVIGEIAGYIAGSFAVLWKVVKETFNLMIESVDTVTAPLRDLKLEAEEMTWTWDVLGGAMQLIGASSRVTATILREVTETFIQMGRATVASFAVIKAGVDRLKGDISKEEFRAIAKDAGEAWHGVAVEMTEDFTKPFQAIKDEFVSFRDQAVNAAGEFESTFVDSAGIVRDAITGALVYSGAGPAPTGGTPPSDTGPGDDLAEAAAKAEAEARQLVHDTFMENITAEWAARAETQRILEETHEAEIAAVTAERELEAQRHADKMTNLQMELDTYAAYAGSAGQLFSNLINSMMQGDEELSKKRKRSIIALFMMQKMAGMGQIALNTASAIVESLPNIPLSIFVAAVGASQLVAAAAARPPVMMAAGGIVMPTPGGTPAILGEAGKPEAVIPLDRLGGMGTTIVNVYGTVGSQEDVATWVYEGIERARHMGKVA